MLFCVKPAVCCVLLCGLEHPRVDNPNAKSYLSVAVLSCRCDGHGMSKYNEKSTSQKNQVEHFRILWKMYLLCLVTVINICMSMQLQNRNTYGLFRDLWSMYQIAMKDEQNNEIKYIFWHWWNRMNLEKTDPAVFKWNIVKIREKYHSSSAS
jgi:hypothetical protein